MNRTLPIVVLLLLCGSSSRAAESGWTQVQTPHFVVIGNASEKGIREIAAGLEQVQSLFAVTNPRLRIESAESTIVLAARDEDTLRDLIGETRNGNARILGMYRNGWEKDYAIVQWGLPDQELRTIYHEYIHKLLHMNFTRLPGWADEGMADFYSLTAFNKNETVLGMPSPRMAQLNRRMSHSVEELVTMTPAVRRRMSGDDILTFYAESWALTHFAILSSQMDGGKRFDAYLTLLQNGVPNRKAFEQAIGKFSDVQKQFDQYINGLSIPVVTLKQRFAMDPSLLSARKMSPAETQAFLGGYFGFTGKRAEAEKRLTESLTQDPQSALAHENMGLLDLTYGRKAEAQAQFDKALQLDSGRYLSLYYRTMAAYQGQSDPDSLSGLNETMQKVLAISPRFAPALVVQSRIFFRQQQWKPALDAALQAQKLQPDRAGYLSNVASILFMQQDYPGAIRVAESVVGRWGGSDSAEAISIVERARRASGVQASKDDQANEAEAMKYAEKTTPAEGLVQSVSCDNERPATVVLRVGDKDMTFGFPKQYSYGHSDTLWISSDHLRLCHHIQGLKAIVRYKANTDSSVPAELGWIEIVDDLIPPEQPEQKEQPAALVRQTAAP